MFVVTALACGCAFVQPAAAQRARALKVACAEPGSGLLRYAPQTSSCDRHGEEAVVLSKLAPIAACVSTAPAFASSGRAGHRIVIPSGTIWRAPSVPYCARLQQLGVTLGGEKPVHVCAARHDGLLRYTRSVGACHAREIELLVAARAPRRKRPPRKPGKPGHQPEPTFAPVAESQSLSTPEDESVSVVLAGHFVNTASGAVGGPVLSFVIASTPAHGTLTGIPPYVVYTPAPGFHGVDSFTFTADVGAHASAAATVSIAVAQVNRAPTLSVPGEQMTAENTQLEFSSADADAISVADEDSGGAAERVTLEAKHGTVTLGSTAGLTSVEGQGSAKVVATGTIVALQEALERVSYTPSHNYHGADSLGLEIDDLGSSGLGGAKTAQASVPISVLTAVYDKALDDNYSTKENEVLAVAAPGVLGNDTDEDVPPLALKAELVSGPAHGALTLHEDGSFSYTPNAAYHGADSFTYRDQDGNSQSNVATVTLAVEQVDQAPSVSLPGAQSTAENALLTFSTAGADAVSVQDSDAESGAEQVVLKVAHGTLKLGSTSGLSEVTGNGSAKVTLKGTVSALNVALEGLAYAPALNYHGADSLEVEINDLGHTGTGGPLSASGSVAITVTTQVYDKAVSDSYSTEENEALEVAAPGVLANDTDSEGLPLTAEVVKGPEHGSLTLNPDGSFKYTPTHDYSGPDSFTYRDQDGNTPSNTATVTLTVNKVVYDTAVDDSYSTREDSKLEVSAPGVLANDTDEDVPPLALKAELVTGPAHGALILHEDGSFSYTPAAGYHGADSFTYRDQDGNSESNVATVTLTVERVDVAPSTSLPGAQSTAENTPLSFSSVGANAISVEDSDSEGEAEQVVLAVAHGTLKLGSTSGLNEVTGNGTAKVTLKGTVSALNAALEGVAYAPALNYHGADSLEVEINDLGHTGTGGPLSASGSVAITVTTQVYDKAVSDSYSTEENEALEVAAPGVLANDTDSEGLPLTAEVVKGPEHGSLTLNPDGSFEYTPAHDYAGPDFFTYRDQDGNTPSNTVTVALTVNKVVYDSAVNNSYSTSEGTKLEVSAPGVLANDTDEDVPPLVLKAELVSDPAHGALTLHEDGSFSYTPEAGYHGADSFSYRDQDGNSESNVATVTLSVEPLDVAPSASLPGAQSTAENSSLTFSSAGANAISVEDSDSEGEAEQVVLAAAHGTLKLASTNGLDEVTGNGTAIVTLKGTIAALNAALEGLIYTPSHNYHGGDSLEVEINDLSHSGFGGPLTATGSVPITVTTVVYDEAVDDSYSTSENQELKVSAPGVLANDKDSDTPPLTLQVKEVTKQPQHGSVTLNADGSFAYTPESSYVGSDSFSYTDTDGNSESSEAMVSITVNAHTNEAPSLTVPGAQEVTENTSEAKTSLAFSGAKSNAVSMADADSEGGVERLKLTVAHGTLAPGSEGGLTVTGKGTASLTLEGSVASIDAGLAGLTYTPTLDYSGSDTLSLEADDLGHSGAGGAKTAESSVAITVKHPNPVPTNPTFSGAIGNTEFSVGVGGSGPDVQVSGSVLPGTTESDGSTLKATAGPIATEHGGSVSMNENGTFTYQPAVGYENGLDSFKYTETDSAGGKATGTATIKVDNARVWYVNDAEAPAGDGESNSPFKALASVGGASTGSGDVIFLYKGSTTYTGGIKLKAAQTLEGQSHGLAVEGHALVSASGTNPAITNSSAIEPGVALASNDAVNGISVESAKYDGIQGVGVAGEVTLTNDSISGSGEFGIDLSAASGALTLDVEHDALTREHGWGISVTAAGGATVLGTIAHDTIGESGVASSGGSEDGGIRVEATGTGDTTTVKISENTLLKVHAGYGIWLRALKQSAILNATVLKNDVEMGEADSREALYATSGEESGDATTMCLHAAGNTLKASGLTEAELGFNAEAILLEVKASATFEVQGTGGGASASQVAKLLETENTLSSPEPEPVFIEEQKPFTAFPGTCSEP